jgi:uncharacterized membrane protein YhhN
MSLQVLWAAIGVISLGGLLWAELAQQRLARAVFKLLCSAGFVLLGLTAGLDSSYARWVLLGLGLSMLGDGLLLSKQSQAFLGGLLAFLLAHLCYIAAFWPSSQPSVIGSIIVLGAIAAVLGWLWPHLQGWKLPVSTYVGVITLMVVVALGVNQPLVQWGAALFAVSDFFVARQRFVLEDRLNALLGLPLYFLGQYLLAFSLFSRS